MKKLLAILLLLPMLVFSRQTANAADSLKQKKHRKSKTVYALDDPRNPDCPCHELQRKAEAEWRRQQAREKAERENETALYENTNTSESAVKSGHKRKYILAFRTKHSTEKKSKIHRKKRRGKKLDNCPDFG